MILFFTLLSWLMIGLALDLAGVFDKSLVRDALDGGNEPAAGSDTNASRRTLAEPPAPKLAKTPRGPRIARWTARARSSVQAAAAPLAAKGSVATTAIDGYEPMADAIVLTYDPAKVPNPSLELRDGDRRGQKRLFLNGRLVMIAEHAERLKLHDINLVEQSPVA